MKLYVAFVISMLLCIVGVSAYKIGPNYYKVSVVNDGKDSWLTYDYHYSLNEQNEVYTMQKSFVNMPRSQNCRVQRTYGVAKNARDSRYGVYDTKYAEGYVRVCSDLEPQYQLPLPLSLRPGSRENRLRNLGYTYIGR